MLNLLRVDIKRYCITKRFWLLALGSAALTPFLVGLFLFILAQATGDSYQVSLAVFTVYSSMAAILLAMLITSLLHEEVGEGIVRNKLISGQKRSHIFLSYCLLHALLALLLQLIALLGACILPLLLGAVWNLQGSELIRLTAISALASMAVSLFFTALYFCFCTSKAAFILPGAVAIIMKVAMTVIMDALYTESGIPKVSGATLKIYKGIDRFLPFAHLTDLPRWDNASYFWGSGVLILLSLTAGLLVFSRKDLK